MRIVAYCGECFSFPAHKAPASTKICGWQTALFTPMLSYLSLPLTEELISTVKQLGCGAYIKELVVLTSPRSTWFDEMME